MVLPWIYWSLVVVGLAAMSAVVYFRYRPHRRFDPDTSVAAGGLVVILGGLGAWSLGSLQLDYRLGNALELAWIVLMAFGMTSFGRHTIGKSRGWKWSWSGLIVGVSLAALFKGSSDTMVVGVAGLGAGFLLSVRQIELERARVREALLQRLSHALRTPAAAIRSLADGLDGSAVDDRAQREQFVSLIRGEADRLGIGIDRLLRLARGEPETPPARVPVDLTEWAHATAERWRPRLGSLRVTAPDRLWAEIDPDKLDEAVEALLDNALRYGGPDVELTVVDTGGAVEVSVNDSGDGLSEEARQRLAAIEAAPDRIPADDPAVHGFGLGLWAASQVARAHGGKLTVDPPSRITLSFPTKA